MSRHPSPPSQAHPLLAPDTVMIRRITALLAMAAIVGLVILLMWDVYLHHSTAGIDDTRVAILGLAS